VSLYRLVFDRLTNYHQLNNLIWVYGPPEVSTLNFTAWYPGDDVIDIVGCLYPSSSSNSFADLDYLKTYWNLYSKIAPNTVYAIAETKGLLNYPEIVLTGLSTLFHQSPKMQQALPKTLKLK
jgi:hypothetical protein